MSAKPIAELLENFKDIAAHPELQFEKYLSEKKKIILTAPVYTPGEIVHAMGLVPFGAWGANVQLDKAKRYFPTFICSIAQSIVELGMNGVYKGATALIVPYLCDSLKVLGENWKCALPEIAFIPMPYPQNRQIPAALDFARAGYSRVIDDLEELTGAAYSDERLAKSIQAYNAHNALMRQFSIRAAHLPAIGPEERSAVFKSAFFLTVEEHTALIEELFSALDAQEPKDHPSKEIRIVTSGILADHPGLLAILKENNMKVVADDVAAESRQYLTDAPQADTALDALAQKFSLMGNCSVLYDKDKQRVEKIVNLAKANKADAVLVVLTKFCDPEEFDIPFITQACEEADIPSLVVEIDRQQNDLGQIQTAVLALGEMLG